MITSNIDPVIMNIYGPFAIRWYGVSYAAGILLGIFYIKYLLGVYQNDQRNKNVIVPYDFLNYLVLGIVIGGRLGHCIFFEFEHYIKNPIEILYLWQGGMAFHGGIIGVMLSMLLFSRKYGVAFWALMDLIAAATPIGIFFGRIANFINAELYGIPTELPWGVEFVKLGDFIPRHPTQIYEALTEGLLNFILLYILITKGLLKKEKIISAMFLIFYSVFRINIEFLKETEDIMVFDIVSTGQFFSIISLLFGIILLWIGIRRSSLP